MFTYANTKCVQMCTKRMKFHVLCAHLHVKFHMLFCLHISVRKVTWKCTRTHMLTHICTLKHACIQTHAHTLTNYLCVLVCMYVWLVSVCVCVCVCVCGVCVRMHVFLMHVSLCVCVCVWCVCVCVCVCLCVNVRVFERVCVFVVQDVPEGQQREDVVGRPIMHLSALKQATGEAVYCDDIPLYENELYVALVTSSKAHARILYDHI